MNKLELEEGKELNIQFDKRGGLVPVIVQDIDSMEILMQGWGNEASLKMTLEKGMATFWSTSRNELWTKGETSGDYLKMVDILTDCDQDVLLYKVKMMGNGACHTKNKEGNARKSCFYRVVDSKNELEKIEE
ncbi:phosphoribosyl-AMP cyclohydrolase [Flammeovirga yaeyamensis]|uniref:Histidine biosynthesis bifunctional protein HisIE n=1 Tax=Flammeovirga yaeyamensis TaxID=367791 RepID=A0AAX1N1X8_9BACT|nr:MULTISPECIES: phosphoribosyl-AMP cyclohydrolase [Flammeovirga]ANQ48201.1 phosphoribosyl-AMP cyclohydrolase [Flammeovirga sp. MY04]MBB3696117.1 phosphoribosyl-AMP cyclohydrolase [Flammeovirga yaeyamensis]NMF34801.1 phosphoribosyl-AMP cyclohydrolase [Flammeovirga yaeyamensis]QWG00371.1 phosphoribosyl-AMP cyclohydrolase [Flammeovirga yaeyamensis]